MAAGCRNETPSYLVDLGGEHRFHVGDDPRFRTPEFDDSDWPTVALPAMWRVRTLGTDVFGWHRLHFEGSDLASSNRLALDLGSIGWADEVFVNGQRIGGTGALDRLPRIGPWPRLYALPDGVLSPGSNVIAIRVRGIPFVANGLIAGRIGIGDELELERTRARSIARTEVAEGSLFGLLALSWLLVAFFPKKGRSGRATFFLHATITLLLLQLWLLSATAQDLQASPAVGGNVVIALAISGYSSYWVFVTIIARGAVPPIARGLIASEVLVALVTFAWADAFALALVTSIAIGGCAAAMMGWYLIGALRAKRPGSIAIALGCAAPAVSIGAMAFLRAPFWLGLPLIYYGLVSAIALAVIALIRHVDEMNEQVQRATKYALDAHLRERSRLARDLHDGLGQMLALLKLQMQRMGRKHEGEIVQRTFDESAEHVAATLDELRRIARDLRPAPMEDRGIGEAVRDYAAAMAKRTDLRVEVEGDYREPLRAGIGDELYRITQECLTNCLKHSGARRVVVTLAEVGDHYLLTVADDGRGLPREIPPGLGLATIRERAELLGGTCTISERAGGGTCVDVSVPR